MSQKDTGTQVNNSTLIFIADKVFGSPVAELESTVLKTSIRWRPGGVFWEFLGRDVPLGPWNP